MDIAGVMTKDVKSCRPGDSLSSAAALMWNHDCGCVPVTDESNHVVGIVTDRDICMAAWFKDTPLSSLRIEDAMAKKLITCKASDPVEGVELLMQGRQIRRVPVVDDAGKLVGIVSVGDLARFVSTPRGRKGASGNGVTATLAAICAPRNNRAVETA